jgi:hypothetical protein
MKFINLLVIVASVGATLNSCVVSDYPGGPVTPLASSLTFGTYETLPTNYVGDAYYYQSRYYYGGNYQNGNYIYQGRPYSSRYYYNGNYYYGGRHEHRDSRFSQRSMRKKYRSGGQIRSENRVHNRDRN